GKIDASRAGRKHQPVDAVPAAHEGETVIAQHDPVVLAAANRDIGAGGDDDVVAALAIEAVIAGPADQQIVAIAADQQIVAATAIDLVVAIVARDPIDAAEADIDVRSEAEIDDPRNRARAGIDEMIVAAGQ